MSTHEMSTQSSPVPKRKVDVNLLPHLEAEVKNPSELEPEIDPAANVDITPTKLGKIEFPHVPADKQNLTFPQAIALVINGGRITRTEWRDPTIYLCADGEYTSGTYLMIHKADGSKSALLLRDGDLLATDWRIVANLEGYIED